MRLSSWFTRGMGTSLGRAPALRDRPPFLKGCHLPIPDDLHVFPPPRGLEAPPRGWSVSLHSGDAWQDLLGCDFVLDLIGQTEDLGDSAGPHDYPITPLGLYVPSALSPAGSPHSRPAIAWCRHQRPLS